jgi:hypothetical protein
LSDAEKGGLMRRDGRRFFPHRLNRDGSYDSICLKCLATVARTTTETELAEHDEIHVCNEATVTERGFVQPPPLYVRTTVE